MQHSSTLIFCLACLKSHRSFCSAACRCDDLSTFTSSPLDRTLEPVTNPCCATLIVVPCLRQHKVVTVIHPCLYHGLQNWVNVDTLTHFSVGIAGHFVENQIRLEIFISRLPSNDIVSALYLFPLAPVAPEYNLHTYVDQAFEWLEASVVDHVRNEPHQRTEPPSSQS